MKKSNIPEWFNLNDYENLKYMNRNQWRLVWLDRLNAYRYLKERKNTSSINKKLISELPLKIKENIFRDNLISYKDTICEFDETLIFFTYQIAKIWGNDRFIKVLDDVGRYVEESKIKKEEIEHLNTIMRYLLQ